MEISKSIKEEMFARAISKGHSQESAEAVFEEVTKSFAPKNWGYAFYYHNFVTLGQAEKMERVFA